MADDNYQKSTFNSAISILMRTDVLWKDSHRHSRTGEYEKWNLDLDRIYIELCADIKPEELEEFDKINKEIASISFKRDKKTDRLQNMSKLYLVLMKKEIFLKKLEKRQGKGMSYEEDLEYYMD